MEQAKNVLIRKLNQPALLAPILFKFLNKHLDNTKRRDKAIEGKANQAQNTWTIAATCDIQCLEAIFRTTKMISTALRTGF